MSHQTHHTAYRGRVFLGQKTQPTVSKSLGPPHRVTIMRENTTHMQYEKRQNTNTQTQINLCTVKRARWDKTQSREL